jgi:dolichol kinase
MQKFAIHDLDFLACESSQHKYVEGGIQTNSYSAVYSTNRGSAYYASYQVDKNKRSVEGSVAGAAVGAVAGAIAVGDPRTSVYTNITAGAF